MDLTFENAVSRLEEITAKIEDASTSVEDCVSLYKEAVKLVKYCTETIDGAELQIKSVIGGIDDIGKGEGSVDTK